MWKLIYLLQVEKNLHFRSSLHAHRKNLTPHTKHSCTEKNPSIHREIYLVHIDRTIYLLRVSAIERIALVEDNLHSPSHRSYLDVAAPEQPSNLVKIKREKMYFFSVNMIMRLTQFGSCE